MFHADIRTERKTGRRTKLTKLIVVLSSFSNAQKNSVWSPNVTIRHVWFLSRLQWLGGGKYGLSSLLQVAPIR